MLHKIITSWLHYFIIQLQSNTKDDYVIIHKSSPNAGPEVTTNKSLYHIESILQVHILKILSTTAWYKLKSPAFPGFFLETLSRASSAKDLSYWYSQVGFDSSVKNSLICTMVLWSTVERLSGKPCACRTV